MVQKKYIASLDVGTTTIRCYIFDSNCQICGSASELVTLLIPEPGLFEIDPEKLWDSIKLVIKNSINDAKLSIKDISSLSISTQRCSFITWDRITGAYFHNFVTWKDLRADDLVQKWNSSFTLKAINSASYLLYFVTRHKRFLAGSVLKMMNSQVTLRLLWQMQFNSKLKDAILNKTALFGTLDSWLLYKLRKGLKKEEVEHLTDITSATATGFYDPFTLSWANWALSLFSIKAEMLPKVVDNDFNFGFVHETIFGEPIKISSSISDQSAALLGCYCFNEGDIKVTVGTGSFLNINTGKNCNASMLGLYPLVAWKFGNKFNTKICYCMEGAANDAAPIINWGLNIGLYSSVEETAELANSVTDSDGVYFIPAFSGIGPPVNNYKAASGFFGIKPSTKREHLTRALLESVAFRIIQVCQCTIHETNYKFSSIQIDGGVSKNNFICQMIADITDLNVERGLTSEGSVLGATFAAFINENICETPNDLMKFRKIGKIFQPRKNIRENLIVKLRSWERIVERFKDWYPTK